jgi:hypothetical protein
MPIECSKSIAPFTCYAVIMDFTMTIEAGEL